uniref:Tetratricopeptide repeat domain 12 n=1 Tax=Kryptolebias marmoratus TaxID=37003 RepID=A0A3Q3FIG0_KRYMA
LVMDNTEDLDTFLRNVDKISKQLEDLRSSDVEVQEKAVAKADCYIAALDESCRTKVNKTTVNTNPPVQPSLVKHAQKVNSAQLYSCFLSVSKMAKVKKATALKDKGNEAYAEGDYETAVKFYSEGLAELKDMQPLYTNRAQVNNFSLGFTAFFCTKSKETNKKRQYSSTS